MFRNSLDKSRVNLTEDMTIQDLNLHASRLFIHLEFLRHICLVLICIFLKVVQHAQSN